MNTLLTILTGGAIWTALLLAAIVAMFWIQARAERRAHQGRPDGQLIDLAAARHQRRGGRLEVLDGGQVHHRLYPDAGPGARNSDGAA